MNDVIRYYAHGAPDVLRLEQEPVPVPGPGQVLLRQQAVGVNYIDTLLRRGIYPGPLPAVPGVEAAGVVTSVGPGVSDWKAGDRGAYFLAPGAYRSVRVVDATALVRLPSDLSAVDAAALLTKGLTAWAGLNGYHVLEPGETVLVQGASSAVGHLLARWAHTRGGRVIATVGTPEKGKALEGEVDHVLDSSSVRLADDVRAIARAGVDVVYEFVGRATFDASVQSVRDGGTIVNIGAASGAPSIDAEQLHARRVRLAGGPMAQHLGAGRQELATAELFATWRAGVFRRVPVTRLPLKHAAAAHESLEARTRAGITVLCP